ncbi:hypothetical protein WJX81_005280 [Elliptochloris bilobata]|uniref:Polycomb protein VEFS-Box domain-containing protein n=1 Tax=Elliptochloris bilobata TaxID=381761 RepID=A0AAW1QZG5_9CHLO
MPAQLASALAARAAVRPHILPRSLCYTRTSTGRGLHSATGAAALPSGLQSSSEGALRVEVTAVTGPGSQGCVSAVVALCKGAADCTEYVPLSARLAHVLLAPLQQPAAVVLPLPPEQTAGDRLAVLILVSGDHFDLRVLGKRHGSCLTVSPHARRAFGVLAWGVAALHCTLAVPGQRSAVLSMAELQPVRMSLRVDADLGEAGLGPGQCGVDDSGSRSGTCVEKDAQPGQVFWRYLFGGDCFAEEQTAAFACALCPLRCCSFEGLVEHLEASHWRFAFASAAGYMSTDYLVEARVAAEAEDESAGGSDAATQAFWAAEFKRRYPCWQNTYFYCPPAQRRQRALLLGPAQARPPDGIFAALPGRPAPKRIVTCRGLLSTWAARKRKLPPPPAVVALEGGRVAGWQRLYHARKAAQMTEREVAAVLANPRGAPDSDDEEDMADWRERSKRRLLAGGAQLVDAEVELVWNWNVHVRKLPIRAHLRIPAACDSFARTYATLLAGRAQFYAAFVAHLLTLADSGLLPIERMDACLALIAAPDEPRPAAA